MRVKTSHHIFGEPTELYKKATNVDECRRKSERTSYTNNQD